ncbi:MAG TPA: flagellar basal body rod protein FlgB [Dissulfuribacter thermophilus]|uniref:Flagellar basal body rod protein FlgB n=1 Tax=Dissulfuribacter thermophilus TaxID=1156395 RepID=A0A7V2SZ51_9BACT|nr:flagellar basal body rod protein FlgB [Dissulfuribacter thermophilus]
MKGLFGKGFDLLDKVLAIRSKKNAVISANIANVDTPGYRAKELSFEKALNFYLKRSKTGLPLRTTDPRHISNQPWEKIAQPGDLIEESKELGTPNNVDLDVEMARLAENNLQYQATLQVLIRRLEALKNAVTEGGRP